jgi:hypothetical protein
MNIKTGATPSQIPVSVPQTVAWFDMRTLLARTLCGLETRIRKMRMALQSTQSYNVQTCISGSGDYQRQSSSLQMFPLSLSELQVVGADEPGPASQAAPKSESFEIVACQSILGYEIVDGRERLMWGKAPDMPWG